MSMTVDPSKPAAQGSTPQPTVDAGLSQPPSNGTGSPPAAPAGDDSERRRLAAEGRRFKALEEQNAGLQTVVLGLQKQLSDLGSTLSAREQREQKAYLDSLPPEDRLEEQIKMLGTRIDAMQSRTTQPVARTEDPVAYQNRRMQEILNDVNTEFGAGITPEERDLLMQKGVLDLSSEDAYARSLKSIAYMATKSGPTTPPQNGQSQGGVGSGQGGPVAQNDQNIDELVEKRAQEKSDEFLRSMGINRPNSARAAVPAGKPTSESYQQLARSFGSGMSPRQRRAAIEKLSQQQ